MMDVEAGAAEAPWAWNGLRFERATVEVVADDLYPETRYAKKDSVKLLRDGGGPYCTFVVKGLPLSSGVYAFVVDRELRYVGRAENLKSRFYGYGQISPKNCYVGGQATNVRMNKLVRNAVRSGSVVEIFFHATPDFKNVEQQMLDVLQPAWNIRGVR